MPAKKQTLSGETDRVLLTLPKDLYAQVQQLADKSDVTPQHFIRRILTEAAQNNVIYPAESGVFEHRARYASKK